MSNDNVKTEALTLSAVRLGLLLPLLLLELHVPIMHHSAGKLVDGEFFFIGEAQHISSCLLNRKNINQLCVCAYKKRLEIKS